MATIMVIDDEPICLGPLCKILEHEGHRVMPMPNGRLALASLFRVAPDIILLDMMMPEVDGLTFLKMLREHPTAWQTPVIVLTGVMESDAIVKARKLGVKDYLLKAQFSLDELLSRISKYTVVNENPEIAADSHPANH